MENKKLRAAVVGCGNIATRYARQIGSYGNLELVGFTDVIPERAGEFAREYGGRAYPSLEAVLADEAVDIVVNLTIHHAHVEVITKSLEAGKHVHTEKPLAMTYEQARTLVKLAEDKGLRLSSAPITYMGEAAQTAWKIIREGRLGKVRLVYAEVNHGRIETWHPNPGPFYAVGVMWDVGVYPLTMLTAFFGPVRKVTAFAKVIHPHRVTQEGKPFHVEVPDFNMAALEFANGAVARLTANFYVKGSKQGGSLEFHGDDGRLYLGNFQSFHAPVEFGLYGEDYEPVPHLREPYEGIEFGRGIEDLADAVLEGRPHRASAAHAAHVVEIVCGIQQSVKARRAVDITSGFTPPAPMPWA